MARAALFQLQLVYQLCPFMVSMVHVLVTFEMDYYNVLYVNMPLKEIYKLLWLQNGMAELLCRIFFFNCKLPTLQSEISKFNLINK